MKLKHADRYDTWLYEENEKGRLFCSTDFQQDLSKVKLLLSSVDTVRQLYRGTLDQDRFEELDQEYEEARNETRIVHLHGFDFVVRPGGASGYKIRLQNNEVGIICFVKTHFAESCRTGTHLKIECSPKLLLTSTPEEVQSYMDGIAAELLQEDFIYGGVALHLALDVQGYEPVKNFSDRIVCRSNRLFARDGIDRAEMTLGEVSVQYGKGQSFTFGSVNALQFAHYNKSKEIISSDKRDFMHAAWSGEMSRNWTPDQYGFDPDYGDVWRLEFRFSHQVLNQFDEGFQTLPNNSVKDIRMKSYAQAFEHLGALWEYAMEQFQLPEGKFYNPHWSLFMLDADFNRHHQDVIYKRVRKEPGIDNARNVALALGNILSIHARHGYSAGRSIDYLRKTGIWDDVLGYLRERKISLEEFNESWRDRLLERRMLKHAA
ncbi:hypothetical protein QKW35_01790 [Pontibacterium granulatum]|uniref:hypothetical protein n=1 Tax=Pontibacterium granulatum TaxID=2036029 RepID=UPI00249C5E64|nr:hypothetical protein [Pontibacterium granulatum]MDI3323095.1 hypothetical protein [Pontibacterium granulatum]